MAKFQAPVLENDGCLNYYPIEPEMYVDTTPRTGFTEYAEKLNGRLAMIGFVSLIGLELATGSSLVELLRNLGQ